MIPKKDQLLNQAIVAYLQKGVSAFPKEDESAVRVIAVNAHADSEELLTRVRTIIEECAAVEIDWSTHSLTEAGR